jgi:hypothetical protein
MSEGEITKGNAGIIYALMLLMFVSGQWDGWIFLGVVKNFINKIEYFKLFVVEFDSCRPLKPNFDSFWPSKLKFYSCRPLGPKFDSCRPLKPKFKVQNTKIYFKKLENPLDLPNEIIEKKNLHTQTTIVSL